MAYPNTMFHSYQWLPTGAGFLPSTVWLLVKLRSESGPKNHRRPGRFTNDANRLLMPQPYCTLCHGRQEWKRWSGFRPPCKRKLWSFRPPAGRWLCILQIQHILVSNITLVSADQFCMHWLDFGIHLHLSWPVDLYPDTYVILSYIHCAFASEQFVDLRIYRRQLLVRHFMRLWILRGHVHMVLPLHSDAIWITWVGSYRRMDGL